VKPQSVRKLVRQEISISNNPPFIGLQVMAQMQQQEPKSM